MNNIRLNESFYKDMWVDLSDNTQGTLYFYPEYQSQVNENPYWRSYDKIKRDTIKDAFDHNQATPLALNMVLEEYKEDIFTSVFSPGISQEMVKEFFKLMDNRMTMGMFRYNRVENQDHEKYDKLTNSMNRMKRYIHTKNRECLVDCCNLLRMEIDYPCHHNYRYRVINNKLNYLCTSYAVCVELYKNGIMKNISLLIRAIIACINEFYNPIIVPDSFFEAEDDKFHSVVPQSKI